MQGRFLVVNNTLRFGCQDLNAVLYRQIDVLLRESGQQGIGSGGLKNRLIVAQ